MGVQVAGKCGQPDGEDGGEREGEGHHQADVQRKDPPDRRRDRDLRESQKHEQNHHASGQHEHACAVPVEELSDERTEETHGEATGHHEQTCPQHAHVAHVLEVDRQQDHHAEHAHECRAHHGKAQRVAT
jgi:hypothetical protein